MPAIPQDPITANTTDLEAGLDELEARSSGAIAAEAAPAPAVAAPVAPVAPEAPDPDPLRLAPPEPSSAQTAAFFTLPPNSLDPGVPNPTAPEQTWDQIKSSDAFKAATPEEQSTALGNYAKHTREYLLGLPGADPSTVDGHTNRFYETEQAPIEERHVKALIGDSNSGDFLNKFLSAAGHGATEAEQAALRVVQSFSGETGPEAADRMAGQIKNLKSDAESTAPNPGEGTEEWNERKSRAIEILPERIAKQEKIASGSDPDYPGSYNAGVLNKRATLQHVIDGLEANKHRIDTYFKTNPEAKQTFTDSLAKASASVADVVTGGKAMITKMALQTYNGSYEQALKANGGDVQKAQHEAESSTLKMAPVLALYAASGKIAKVGADALLPETAGLFTRAAVGATTSAGANLTASFGVRGFKLGNTQENLTDALFGIVGGMHELGGSEHAPAVEKIKSSLDQFTTDKANAAKLEAAGMPKSAKAQHEVAESDLHDGITEAHEEYQTLVKKHSELEKAIPAPAANTNSVSNGNKLVVEPSATSPGETAPSANFKVLDSEGNESSIVSARTDRHVVSTAVMEDGHVLVGPKFNTPHEGIGTYHDLEGVAENKRGFIVQGEDGKQQFVARPKATEIAKAAGQADAAVTNLQSADLKPESTEGGDINETKISTNDSEARKNGQSNDQAERPAASQEPLLNGEGDTPLKSIDIKDEASRVREEDATSEDDAASLSAGATDESQPSAVKDSTSAHEQATVQAAADALRERGAAPDPELPDQVGKRYASVKKLVNELKGDSRAHEAMLDLVRDDLIANAKKTGDPFTTTDKAGKEVPYSVTARLIGTKSRPYGELTNYLKAHSESKRAGSLDEPAGEEGEHAVPEPATPRTPYKDATEAESEKFRSEFETHVAKTWAAFAADKNNHYEGANASQVVKAAKLLMDAKLPGKGRNFTDRRGIDAGDAVDRLTKNPDFQKAVDEQIFGKLSEFAKASTDAGILAPRGEIHTGIGTILDSHAIDVAASQVRAGVPIEHVVAAMPESIQAKVRDVTERYELDRGINNAMRRIADTITATPEGKLQQVLAKALSLRGRNDPVTVDPTLELRRGAAAEFIPRTGETKVSPFLSEPQLQKGLVHEKTHEVLYDKTESYLRGDYDQLDAGDVANLKEVMSLRDLALAHESVPESIREAAAAADLKSRQSLFDKARSADSTASAFYGLLDPHEFMTGLLGDSRLQKFLNGIKTDGTPAEAKSAAPTIWTRLKQLLRNLVLGGEPVAEGSVLARGFDLTVDLLKSGSQDDMTSQRVFAPEEGLKSPFDAAKYEGEKRDRFMTDFAAEHGYSTADGMAASDPHLYNEAAKLHTGAVEEVIGLRMAAEDPKVQDATEKRAEGLFAKVDALGGKTPAAKTAREAMENGASTAEEFADAFSKAGMEPEAAQAVGAAVESHFRLAGMEKAEALVKKVATESSKRVEASNEPVPADADGEPNTTSIKNARVDQERADRDLPPAVQSARKEFGTTWSNALDRIERDPKWQDDLISKLQQKSRPVTDEENAALLHRQIGLQTDYDRAANDINSAHDAGDTAALGEAKARFARIKDDLFDLYNVNKSVGTETARGLVTRKMLAREDYTLSTLETRARAANDGEPLSKEQSAEIKALTEKIFKLQQDAIGRQDKIDGERSEDQAEAATKDLRDKVAAKPTGTRDLNAERANIIKGMRETLKDSGDVKDLQPYIQKLAENLVRRGIDKTQTLTNAVHKIVQLVAPEMTRRDVMDAISGYGDFKKLSQDAIKVQLRDLKGQMQQGAKIEDMLGQGIAPSKTGVERRSPSDKERRLIELVNEAKKKGDFVVTDPATQLKGALDAVKTRLKNQIKDLSNRIFTGEKQIKKEGVPYDEEAQTLKALRDRVQETLTAIEGKPEMSDEKRVEIAKAATQKSIDEYDRRLKEDDFSLKEGRKTPVTPELEALRAQRDALRAEYKWLEDAAHPERRMEAALAAFKSRATARIAELTQKIATNDFAPKPPRKASYVLDAAGEKIEADLERTKDAAELALRRYQLDHRTGPEKGLDFLAKWGRATKLTAISTLGKLTAAAAHRMVTTPIEEAIGAGLGQVPILKEAFNRAPSEGGFNVKATAKMITEGLTTGMKDAYDTIKTGKSSLNAKYGSRTNLPHDWIEFAGTLHGAMKAPTRRAAFTLSLEKRIAFADKQGVDVTEPTVQMKLMLEAFKASAYLDSGRSIFMQDNRAADSTRQLFARWERVNADTGEVPLLGKIAATTGRVIVPIVKVPTNYVAEAFVNAGGLGSGSYKLFRAWKKGFDNMTPDEADVIARHLKKGSLGAAVLALGFFNPAPGVIQAGGYYQPGEKRKDGDLKAGELRVFGVHIPTAFSHTPLLEVFQVGATMRRVANAQISATDQRKQGLTTGAFAGLLGLGEEVPFVGAMFDTHKMQTNPAAYFGDIGKGIVVPGALQNIAAWMDRDSHGETVKRDPKNFLQRLETGIPILRKTVPRKKEKISF